MLAPSEAHVRCGVGPTEDEFIRPIKNFRITICGCIAQRHRLPWFYGLAMQVHVLGGCTCEAAVRTVQSQELLHRCRNKRLVFTEFLLQVLVLGQVVAYGSDQDRWRDDTDD